MKILYLNRFYTALGFIALLLCTYFRENILLEINALIAGDLYDRSYSYWFVTFFKSISVERLVYWKWGVTLFFTILIPVITIVSLYSWFQNKAYRKILVIIYLICFCLLVLIAGIGLLFNCFDSIYFFLRKIIGIVQSPVPFFLFFLVFYQFEKKENQPYL
tara:strand:- start:280 stop:762 length:483 start_codon:yes stop_codon:yes gene_type:complete